MIRTNIQIAARLAIVRKGAPAADPNKGSNSVARSMLRPELLDITGIWIKMVRFFPIDGTTGKLIDILTESAPDGHDIDQIGHNRPRD
tara:strand:- start:8 stop:271 length:264 start_codon:yes stop_codon:yes gene_type:complete